MDTKRRAANIAAPAEEYLSPAELARELRVPVSTVYAWRTKSQGPRAIRVGKHLRFARSEVARWLEEQSDPVPA